ncbi:MAG: cytochrome c [Aureispira sp.]|nr:cytochrome c [Aureispira sp.]
MTNYIFLLVWFCLFFSACSSINDPYAEGKPLYLRHCANCHMDDGSGLEGLIPPLAKADVLQNAGASAACMIRNGLKGKMQVNGIEYDGEMLPNAKISDVEILNILNYINNAWGNQRDFIKLDDVKTALKGCQ